MSEGCNNHDHDERFKGLFFAKNGCLACQCEHLAAEKEIARKSLRDTEDQLIKVANYVGAKCGDGVPEGKGDTLADAIIRKVIEMSTNKVNLKNPMPSPNTISGLTGG